MNHQERCAVSRYAWRALGVVSLAVGIIGSFVPVLPTVPFLILAAFAFERSSERLHNWLMNHPRLGPPIETWRRYGAISRRAKLLSMVMIVVVFALSLFLGVETWVLVVQAVALTGASAFILSRPDPPSDV